MPKDAELADQITALLTGWGLSPGRVVSRLEAQTMASALVKLWPDAAEALTAEPTEAEKRARWDVESRHHFHGVDCLCGFTSPVSRQRTEHITGALMDALRAARGLL